jgi:RNA polymerase sigma-70 factor (ECF subfamily)
VNADDRRLISECLQGRPEAFGDLVRRYENRLYNTVLRLVENPDDAQDVVQEAFFSAFQSLGSFNGRSEFFTWLYRIAFNTAISLKRKRRAVVRLESGRDRESGVEPHDDTELNQPGRDLERSEDQQRVLRALARLSPEHRAVMVLKDLEDQKYETIAEILQVPIGTIRSRLHRARLELRSLLEADEQ